MKFNQSGKFLCTDAPDNHHRPECHHHGHNDHQYDDAGSDHFDSCASWGSCPASRDSGRAQPADDDDKDDRVMKAGSGARALALAVSYHQQ